MSVDVERLERILVPRRRSGTRAASTGAEGWERSDSRSTDIWKGDPVATSASLLTGELQRIHYLTALPRGRAALDRRDEEARRVVLITAWVELSESSCSDLLRHGADHIAEGRLAVDVWAEAFGRLYPLGPRAGGIFRGSVLVPASFPERPPPLRLVAYQPSTGRLVLRGVGRPALSLQESRSSVVSHLPRILLRARELRPKGYVA